MTQKYNGHQGGNEGEEYPRKCKTYQCNAVEEKRDWEEKLSWKPKTTNKKRSKRRKNEVGSTKRNV